MRYHFILLLMVSFLAAKAQDQTKVVFQNTMTWQSVLDSAKKENKMVFVDIYTDWCLPCKRMEAEVFSLKAVADTFNNRFINYRVNAEKGDGIQIARNYGVSGYPYFIFVNGDGTLYYSMLGYRDEQQLLQDAITAFKEANDSKPFGIWKTEYDAKKYDTAWLSGYIQKRNKLRMDNQQLLEDYYNKLKPSEYMKAGNVLLVANSNGIDITGQLYAILTKHFNRISPAEDTLYRLQEKLLAVFENAVNKVAVKAIEEKNEAAILNIVVPAHDAFPDSVRFMPWYRKPETNWKFLFYQHTNNLKKAMPVMTAYIKKYYLTLPVGDIQKKDRDIYLQAVESYRSKGLDSQQLNNMLPMLNVYFKTYATNDHLRKLSEAAALVYNNGGNAVELNTALGWMRRATEIAENAANLEMTAKLLYRLRRKQEAMEAMQKAISKSDIQADKDRLTLLLENIRENKEI